MPLLDHFDILAPFYDRIITVPDTSQLVDLLSLPIHGRLLDVGGGTGRISQTLIDKTSEVIIVDLSINMLLQATDKGKLARICSYSESLPFEEGVFDRIIMVDALHHVINQENTATELWRVLKPGGKLVIEEPDVSKLIVKFIALAEKAALMRSKFLPPEKIAALFPAGLSENKIFRQSINSWVVVEKNSC